jgi:competence protein ComEC
MDGSEITVSFLDVGQGDSAVIILPDRSSAIVVDCSCDSGATIDYLEVRNVNILSWIFVTHSHLDHMGGAALLVENFGQIDTIAFNLDTFLVAKDDKDRERRQTTLRHLAQLITNRGLRYCNPRADQNWTLQGVVVDVLHPDDQDRIRTIPRGDTNNASVVLRVAFARRRVLLAADIEGQGWQWMVERSTDLQADIFKFPHHGAWYDVSGQQPSLDEVLRRIDPSLVVISVGTHNQYNHPNPKTLELLRSYPQLRFVCTEATPKCHSSLKSERRKQACPCAGTVEVIIGNERMEVTPDCNKHSGRIKLFDRPQCRAESHGRG